MADHTVGQSSPAEGIALVFSQTIGRFGGVAVLIAGFLVVTAEPAVATVHDFAIEGSSALSINGTSRHFGGHITTNVCSANSNPASTFPADIDSSGAGTIRTSAIEYRDVVAGTNTFKMGRTITGGTVNITPSTITMALVVQITIRTCSSLTVLCATNPINITLTGPNPSGSLHPGSSAAFTLSGTAHVTAPFTCNPLIRPSINSQMATVSWNVHVTT